MTPKTAILATLFVPGSAHLALGHTVRGLVAFVVTVGLFWVGFSLAGSHMWYLELLPTDGLIGPLLRYVPLQMLPEAPNLGCTTIAAIMRDTSTPDLVRLERMPREFAHLGLLLSSVSGVLNCLWMADAHWLAQKREPKGRVSPAVAAAATWLLPGAGHVLAGQKDKGILVGAAVLVMFFAGLAFAGGHAVDRVALAAWYDGQVLCGTGVIFGSLITAPLRYETLPLHHDLGVTLTTVAGFMNLLVMTNAYTVAEDGPDSVVLPEEARS